jgi:hypothetical protein
MMISKVGCSLLPQPATSTPLVCFAGVAGWGLGSQVGRKLGSRFVKVDFSLSMRETRGWVAGVATLFKL